MDRQAIKSDVSWLSARLQEKSTYAGLAVLIGLFFPHFVGASELVTDISQVGMGIGALAAMFMAEKSVS